MSKLSKLLNNPKRFAVDSKLYRQLSFLRARAATALRESSGLAWSPTGVGEDLLAELVAEIGHRIPILDLSEPGSIEVATPNTRTHDVTAFLWELQQKPNVEVVLDVSRKQLELRDAPLLAADAFISGASSVVAYVSFSDKQESVSITFEFWDVQGFAHGPRNHILARRIPERVVDERKLFKKGRVTHARELHRCKMIDEPDFPIDIVYTWVNHLDTDWRRLRAEATGTKLHAETDDGRSLDRFLNRDELRYSLRSVAQFAPWVRKVFVATNCAPPEWVNLDNPRLEWVDHAKFIPVDALPTFSSHAIESRLQHIPGLASHFIYFNDDFFLTRPTTAGDYFAANGLSRSFIEGYGTVIGDVHADDPDYLNAARNGKRLLEEAFERSATSLHRHTPYALRKDVLLEMEQRFELAISRTTRNQFRTQEDISTTSFLYHHYAFLTGRALYEESDAWLIKPETPKYERKLAELLGPQKRPISICLNDGGGSTNHPHWGRHIVEFLETFFPNACEFER